MYEGLNEALLLKHHFQAVIKFDELVSAIYPMKFEILLDTSDDVFLRRYKRLDESSEKLENGNQSETILVKSESVH